MKNYLFILLYAFLFASCDSTDVELSTTEVSHFSKPTQAISPLNPANAFDYVGQVHYDLSLSYYADTFLPKSSDSIVSQVNLKASAHPFFDGFLFGDYNLVPLSRIDTIVSNSADEFSSILANLPLTAETKNEFSAFVGNVLSKVTQDVDYEAIYHYVVLYESTVQNSNAIAANDKEYLLSVTSIIRHSVYAKRKRPKKNTDPDWDWLTANITGAIEGAQYGKSHAVLTALKAGIIENR